MNISTTADGKRTANLIGHLAPAADAEVLVLGDLGVVVQETNSAVSHQGEDGDPDVGIAQVRPEERGDDDGNNDEDAAHGGRACFFLMGFRPFLTDVLSDLELAELMDQPGSEGNAEEQRRQARERRCAR